MVKKGKKFLGIDTSVWSEIRIVSESLFEFKRYCVLKYVCSSCKSFAKVQVTRQSVRDLLDERCRVHEDVYRKARRGWSLVESFRVAFTMNIHGVDKFGKLTEFLLEINYA